MKDIREESIRYSLSELARENITPDIDFDNTPTPLIEVELVDMLSMYLGQEVAAEAKRLFVNESIA